MSKIKSKNSVAKKSNKQTSIRINEELYAHLKHQAEETNRTFSNLVETLLIQSTGFRAPNKTTLEAMREAMENKGLEKLGKGKFKDLVKEL